MRILKSLFLGEMLKNLRLPLLYKQVPVLTSTIWAGLYGTRIPEDDRSVTLRHGEPV